MKINYEILDYQQVNGKLDKLKQISKIKSIQLAEIDDFPVTRLGYKIRHFAIGQGNKHIIMIANTHGSEIISCDFLLKVMESIIEKKNGFENYDDKKVTLDIIPLHNPEGYIISTSAIKTIINNNMSDKEKEAICKKYYELYRQDDIDSKINPLDHKTLKKHQLMFSEVTYKNIGPEHKNLRDSVQKIYDMYKHPQGSMITWRANGSGVDLNRNQPFNSGIVSSNKIQYGPARYNNILKNVPGPLGTSCFNKDAFTYEPENIGLINLIETLYKQGKYCGLLTYHSTYGKIFAYPSFEADESVLDDEKRYKISAINNFLAEEYAKYTGYDTIDNPDFEGFDELFRVLYPGVLLIELSEMGGNPIAPYGDIKGNYEKTITENMIATKEIIKTLCNIQPFIYDEKILIRKDETKNTK